jgi:hypothetical protein
MALPVVCKAAEDHFHPTILNEANAILAKKVAPVAPAAAASKRKKAT